MAVSTQRRETCVVRGNWGEELGRLDQVVVDTYVPVLLFPWQMWNKKEEMRRYHFLMTSLRS